jgi:hypothetical protein
MNIAPALSANNFHHLHNETEIIKLIIGLQTQIRYFNTTKNLFNNLFEFQYIN